MADIPGFDLKDIGGFFKDLFEGLNSPTYSPEQEQFMDIQSKASQLQLDDMRRRNQLTGPQEGPGGTLVGPSVDALNMIMQNATDTQGRARQRIQARPFNPFGQARDVQTFGASQLPTATADVGAAVEDPPPSAPVDPPPTFQPPTDDGSDGRWRGRGIPPEVDPTSPVTFDWFDITSKGADRVSDAASNVNNPLSYMDDFGDAVSSAPGYVKEGLHSAGQRVGDALGYMDEIPGDIVNAIMRVNNPLSYMDEVGPILGKGWDAASSAVGAVTDRLPTGWPSPELPPSDEAAVRAWLQERLKGPTGEPLDPSNLGDPNADINRDPRFGWPGGEGPPGGMIPEDLSGTGGSELPGERTQSGEASSVYNIIDDIRNDRFLDPTAGRTRTDLTPEELELTKAYGDMTELFSRLTGGNMDSFGPGPKQEFFEAYLSGGPNAVMAMVNALFDDAGGGTGTIGLGYDNYDDFFASVDDGSVGTTGSIVDEMDFTSGRRTPRGTPRSVSGWRT